MLSILQWIQITIEFHRCCAAPNRHGYGISPEMALNAVNRLEGTGRNVESFHKELEALTLMM